MNIKKQNIMKTMSTYRQAKAHLKEVAKTAKKDYKNDLPAIRMIINDYADMLCKEYNFSDYYRDLLSNYACLLHPKKETSSDVNKKKCNE